MKNKNALTLDNYFSLKDFFSTSGIEDNARGKIRSKWKTSKKSDIQKLLLYSREYSAFIDVTVIVNNLKRIRLAIVIMLFIVGLFAGFGLLEHGGNSKVNIMWFFMVLILIPFLFSIYTFYILLSLNFSKNTEVDGGLFISTMSDILKKITKSSKEIAFYDKVIPSFSLLSFQWGSLALLGGTFISLVVVMTGKHIALGWESTLLDSSAIQTIINLISFPWSGIFPSAVPSLELIQNTQYFVTNNQNVANNTGLNSWIYFLAMSLAVWGFFPRVALLYLANKNLNRTLEKSILSDENAKKLLKFMNEEYRTTTQKTFEEQEQNEGDGELLKQLDITTEFTNILGWNFADNEFQAVLKSKKFKAISTNIVGSSISMEEEKSIIKSIKNKVLDLLDDISSKNIENIYIYPVGVSEKDFIAEYDDIKIWENKVLSVSKKYKKIGMYYE